MIFIFLHFPKEFFMLYPVVKTVLEKSENCLSYKPVTKVTLTLLVPDTLRTYIKPSAEPREVTCDSFRGGGSQMSMLSGSTDGEFAVGLLSAIATVLPVPIVGIYNMWKRKGSCLEKLRSVVKPTDRWGPATFKMRKVWLNRYSGTLTAETVSDFGSSIFSRDSLKDDFHYVTAHMTTHHPIGTHRSFFTATCPTIQVKESPPPLPQPEAGLVAAAESTGVDLPVGSPLSTDLEERESCVDVSVTPPPGTLGSPNEMGSDKTPGGSSLQGVAD
ncbi:uncharacterized protein [Littorina saxatilis]